jgi:hypothetical protein
MCVRAIHGVATVCTVTPSNNLDPLTQHSASKASNLTSSSNNHRLFSDSLFCLNIKTTLYNAKITKNVML